MVFVRFGLTVLFVLGSLLSPDSHLTPMQLISASHEYVMSDVGYNHVQLCGGCLRIFARSTFLHVDNFLKIS